MAITQDDLFREMDRIKKQGRPVPEAYQEFLPSAIPLSPKGMNTGLLEQQMHSIVDSAEASTNAARIQQANFRDYQAMLEAQERLATAEKALDKTKRPKIKLVNKQPNFVTKPYKVRTQPAKIPAQKFAAPLNTKGMATGGKGMPGMSAPSTRGKVVRNTGSGAWKDPTPFRGTGVGQNLVTIHTPGGRSVTVNRDMADNFSNFLRELTATGYKISSIGGYANRGNTSNPSVKSMHAYGLAIDINPSQNPYGNSLVTNMPKGVSRLAAKYGLQWGGNWNSVKDAMHFSMRGGYGGSAG